MDMPRVTTEELVDAYERVRDTASNDAVVVVDDDVVMLSRERYEALAARPARRATVDIVQPGDPLALALEEQLASLADVEATPMEDWPKR